WIVHRVEGVTVPFILIAIGTYAGTLAIYHFLIRPYPVMRFLHGLRTRPAAEVKKTSSSHVSTPSSAATMVES
ncbi:MAG: hypothetical protein AAF449_00185, partial [Myxococcota bacterium]